ncbi:MAG: hypothetical protein LBQ76_01535 [Candidatus Fibromonas sp.]|nr:hypothetical protein [Candidatus Fibromonas sp.]
MNRITLITGILLVTAFIFSCGDEPDDDPAIDADNTCGGSLLNSSVDFCYAEEIFKKCDGRIYNPLDSFCYNNKVYGRCGGIKLNIATDFCYGDMVYAKCNGIDFNPLNFYCDMLTTPNKVSAYKKCSGVAYDDRVSFCDTSTTPNKVYDRCGSDNREYDPLEYFCYYGSDSKILEKKCDGMVFDRSSSFCFGNNIYDLCGNNKYDPLNSFCYNDVVYTRCGGMEYDGVSYFCDRGTLYPKCNKSTFNPLTELCRGNLVVPKKTCGSGFYDDSKYFCDMTSGKIYELCNTEIYAFDKNFCYENKLYPKCQNGDEDIDTDGITEEYNPYKKGCFEKKLYPVCGADGVLGICVQGTVLRCKQAGGSGEEYTVKPYPGMKCLDSSDRYNSKYLKYFTGEYRGKIVGDITYGSRSYSTVQIGEQVWMAENLANVSGYLFYWGGDTGACKGCLDDKNNTLTTVSHANRKGSCPNGWRVPSSKDWQDLVRYAGGDIIAGNRLKSTSDWGQGNGLDNYGFNAKPLQFKADIPSPLSTLNALGAFWWTSTTSAEPNTHMAKFWYVISSDTEAEELAYEKEYFQFSVRCLQNIE